MNEELLKVQKEWEKQCYAELKNMYAGKENEKGELSRAFSFGVTEHYVQSDKRIMIVGQEANGHTFDDKNWRLENWQKWAIEYLNFQIYDEKSKYSMTKNSSPFWQFFKYFDEKGYGVCWNNLDKVRRYLFDGKEWVEDYLPYDDKNSERALLNKKLSSGSSLLKQEIEIAKPDCVIFAVGPKNPFYHTLCNVLFEQNTEEAYNKLLYKYPSTNQPFCNITDELGLGIPAYYTYHPHFLILKKGGFKRVAEDIMNELKKHK